MVFETSKTKAIFESLAATLCVLLVLLYSAHKKNLFGFRDRATTNKFRVNLKSPSQHDLYQESSQTQQARLQLWYPWERHEPTLSSTNQRLDSRNTTLVLATPIYITCGYNKGRAGHELKDVATVFILATWFGWIPCAQDWWTYRSVQYFNPAFAIQMCPLPKSRQVPPDLLVALNTTTIKVVYFVKTSYDGLAWADIMDLKQKGQQTANALFKTSTSIHPISTTRAGVVIMYLDKSTRVHMHQVYNWFHEKRLPISVFEPTRRALQARFFRRIDGASRKRDDTSPPPQLSYLENINSNAECQNNTNPSALCIQYTNLSEISHKSPTHHSTTETIYVAAHFRRGDVGLGMSYGEWTSAKFAQRFINQVRHDLRHCKQNVQIHIFTEKGAKDLAFLQNATRIWSGASWEHDMSCFINADMLVITNSSLSTWAAQFARGLIVVPSGNAKHFSFSPYPSHVIPFVSTLDIPHEWMRKWGCVSSIATAPATAIHVVKPHTSSNYNSLGWHVRPL